MSDAAAGTDPTITLLEIRVRFCETDLMGIVHHGNHLVYYEAGRVEWLRRRGITYADWARRGIHLPVVEASVKYRAPAYFEDLVTIETRLADLRSHSLRYDYTMRRGEDVLATGTTRLACVDGKHALMRIPDEVVSVLRSGELG